MGQDCWARSTDTGLILGSVSLGMLVSQVWVVTALNRRFSHIDSGIDRPLTLEAIQGRFPRGGVSGELFLFLNFLRSITYSYCLKYNSNLKLKKVPSIKSRNS